MEPKSTQQDGSVAGDPASEALSASSPLSLVLHDLVDEAVAAIEGATLAGIAVDVIAEEGRREITVDSSSLVSQMHVADPVDGAGPGHAARSSGEVVRISSTAEDGPWEEFRDACRSIGIMSTASFPIQVSGERQGTLTIYSPDYHAFDVGAIRAGRRVAIEIGTAIGSAGADWY